MKTLNARIVVSVELDDGQRRDFDLDNGTIEISSYAPDDIAVDVFDNGGDLLSSTEEGGAALAHRVGSWLYELRITDDEFEQE